MEDNLINDDTAVLLCKAASGELDPMEEAKWLELCSQEPRLKDLLADMVSTSEDLRKRVTPRVEPRQKASGNPPEHILEMLEASRKEIFSRPIEKVGLIQSFSNLLASAFSSPAAPAFAAVALIALVGALILRPKPNDNVLVLGGDPEMPLVFKNAMVNLDLPIISPGSETSLTDPDVIWVSLGADPVEVSILDLNETPIAEAKSGKSPMAWETFSSGRSEIKLKPGSTYLVALRQGTTKSQRVVKIREDALNLDEILKGSDPIKLAMKWNEEGRPEDVLSLTNRLSARAKASGSQTPTEIIELREKAFDAASKAKSPAPQR